MQVALDPIYLITFCKIFVLTAINKYFSTSRGYVNCCNILRLIFLKEYHSYPKLHIQEVTIDDFYLAYLYWHLCVSTEHYTPSGRLHSQTT